MIIIYPEEFRDNAPEGALFNVDKVDFDGFLDQFILIVNHVKGCSNINYNMAYQRDRNVHIMTTFIDCGYVSENLKFLIDKFKKIEEIWNA